MSDPWESLLGSALIGSERRPALPLVLRDVPELAGVASLSPPERILACAALLGGARRAGWQPGQPPADVGPPSPPDDNPAARCEAMALFELLAGGMVEVPGGGGWLLAEWLERCRATNHRLPPKALAWLLDQASAAPALRPAVVAAGGSLAGWLGDANPIWSWARAPVPPPAEPQAVRAAWRGATRAQRLVLLHAVRTDNPSLGRHLVAEARQTAPAAERAALFNALAHGLGPDDEELLDAALDDQSAPVREAALTLLVGLATSRRAQRMMERLAPLVRVTGRVHPRLLVDFPEPPDEAARRDGVGGVGPPSGRAQGGMGERAQWLLQLVASAPLDFWGEHLGQPPLGLVRLGAEHPALLGGWAYASRFQHDNRWATVLLAGGGAAPDLARLLDPNESSTLLLQTMAEVAIGHPRAAALLANCGGPWNLDASAAVIARLAVAGKELSVYGLALGALATNLDPDVSPQLDRWLATVGGRDRVSRSFHGLPHALGLRRRIAEVFPPVDLPLT